MRYHKDKNKSLQDNILQEFASITPKDMINFYLHTTNFDPSINLVLDGQIFNKTSSK